MTKSFLQRLLTGLLATAVVVTLPLMLTRCKKAEPMAAPADLVTTLGGTLSDFSLSTGNTYPAIALPWGMNFWTPQTGRNGNGWIYVYSAHKLRGLKQTHQPSPWINDYGQFSLMPVRDASLYQEDARASSFSHKSEVAKPYYYSVYLADHDVVAELTPTERAAVMRFTFPESGTSGVVIDAFDKGSYIKVLPDKRTVEGYSTRNSGGVPDNFCNWFVITFDKPIEGYDIYDGDLRAEGDSCASDHVIAVVRFATERGEKVQVRVASSFISQLQAYQNLQEVAGRDFEEVKTAARDRWNDILGRVEVSGGTEEQYRTFYSCLYRSVLFPRKFYEINAAGEMVHYSPYDGQVHKGPLYTDSGFWDTFRALFPLLNLLYPEVNAEMQEGYANIVRENPFLPEWASPGHRNCMVGNNSCSLVTDAVLQGVTEGGFDDLYRAMVYATENVHPTASSTGRLGHEYYNRLGYIPDDVGIRESVARTLEYAYDDWCILQMARHLGRPQEELDKWAERAKNYRNVFDRESSLMRGRHENGDFETPFNPYKWGGAFTEGNAWHYTWSVFHDIGGLMDLMGGQELFARMLDSVFVVPPIYDDSYYGFPIHEIVEMTVANMGNYAHGNQPAQHIIYLYDYALQPWKAQWWARETMDRLYSATPDAYCGDEDNGQTSAWYVFSALGFYPVCPGSGEYCLGSPLFKKAVLHLAGGKTLRITAENNAPDRRYVDKVKLNNRNWTRNYVRIDDLKQGAKLDFVMSGTPNTVRGTEPSDRPYSFSDERKTEN